MSIRDMEIEKNFLEIRGNDNGWANGLKLPYRHRDN